MPWPAYPAGNDWRAMGPGKAENHSEYRVYLQRPRSLGTAGGIVVELPGGVRAGHEGACFDLGRHRQKLSASLESSLARRSARVARRICRDIIRLKTKGFGTACASRGRPRGRGY